MGQAAGILGVLGGAIGIYSAAGAYKDTKDSWANAYNISKITSGMQAQQFGIQAAFLAQQAGAFMSQSDAFMRQSSAYVQQAEIANKTGQILQANEMHRAAQAEKEADLQAKKAAELRRQMVGSAKTQFAANGVLLESRPQSAVAMWEQDEETDLAFELSGIRESRDNEVWGFVWSGTQQRLQGLFDAQALKLQSDASKIEAGNARMNAASSIAQSRMARINASLALMAPLEVRAQGQAATDAARWNLYGSIGSMLGSSAASLYAFSGSSGGKSLTRPNNDASSRMSSPYLQYA